MLGSATAKRAKYLRHLGLQPDATLDDINGVYEDYLSAYQIGQVSETQLQKIQKAHNFFQLEVLGLTEEASFNEVKSTYRKLAVRFHPDKGGQVCRAAPDALRPS